MLSFWKSIIFVGFQIFTFDSVGCDNVNFMRRFVEKQTRIRTSESTLQISKAESVLHCAILCKYCNGCCSGSFDSVNTQCVLDSTCFPVTDVSTTGITFLESNRTAFICDTAFCHNGGQCVPLNATAYECNCTTEYYGSQCNESICDTTPCSNGRICTPTGLTTYTCDCQLGYSDPQCNTYVCAGSLCNNGTCNPLNETDFSCTCYFGYHGDTCTEYVCDPNPCNNGSCIATGNSTFDCDCATGYSGPLCETYACDTHGCLNNGTCIPTGDSTYNCSCLIGFSGQICDVTPCTSGPCLNGGTCTVVGSTFSCQCTWSYYQTRCEYPLSSCAPPRGPRCLYVSPSTALVTCQCDVLCHLQGDCCADTTTYCDYDG